MILMSRHVIPEMRKNGKSSIVSMSSVSGREYHPGLKGTRNCSLVPVTGGDPNLLYLTSNAIIQMTRAMAAQHGPENLRVSCVFTRYGVYA